MVRGPGLFYEKVLFGKKNPFLTNCIRKFILENKKRQKCSKNKVTLAFHLLSIALSIFQCRDFPGGPVGKTVLPMQGAQVRSLVGELDPACQPRSVQAATKKSVCHN